MKQISVPFESADVYWLRGFLKTCIETGQFSIYSNGSFSEKRFDTLSRVVGVVKQLDSAINTEEEKLQQPSPA